MKAAGLLLAVLGWLIPVAALTWTASPAARLILSVLGMAMGWVGILGFLNRAHLKSALWKR